jgi:hypothetical protein
VSDYVPDPRVDQILAALPEWHREICQRVREIAHAADPEVDETVKRTSMPFFVMRGNVCALMPAKRHVSIFLYDPTAPDPNGIITAGHDNRTGRQISIHPGETLNEQALTEMLRAIVANNRAGGWRKLSRP